jgi:tetratricopeptide (TPR) repeat protein
MELQIIENDKNSFPLKGMLVKSNSVLQWVKEIQFLGLSLTKIQIYPIPGQAPNTIWGCLVVFYDIISRDIIGKHQLCQEVCPNLFIPERSSLHPFPTAAELKKLFSSGMYIAHPDFGWVELPEQVNLQELIAVPVPKELGSTKPSATSFIPMTVRSFQIHSLPPEEVLKNLEDQIFPKHKSFDKRPLNVFEKTRLQFYKMIFDKRDGQDEKGNPKSTAKTGPVGSFFSNLFKSVDKKNRMQQDFEDLEERNKKNIDKLMDLLQKDPDRALQYAIPLDSEGTTRGGPRLLLDLSKRWFDFDLNFNRRNNSGSGIIDIGEHFNQLQKQYHLTAEELIKRREYQKAAFVYMKLLKNYRLAAGALEAGKHYQEAATLYLNHVNDKVKAAECYEKGNMTMDAINLYVELNDHEKVGDLYVTISNHSRAILHYKKVVDDYKTRSQYVKASLLCKDKMKNPAASQSILVEGWRINKDAVNCLCNYFSNIQDSDELHKELDTIYKKEVTEQNRESFLQVIKHEYRRKSLLRDSIKEMAYEIVSKQILLNPSIVSELKNFSPENNELFKDTLRFKLKKNSKQ